MSKELRDLNIAMKKKILNAAPQPSAEPVAFVDGLPEGTTHITKLSATIQSGGCITISTNAFKYQDGELLVYQTDNDNEYPGWRFAKDVFYRLDFPITPIHAPDDTALLRQALEALERAKAGLQWYQDSNPEQAAWASVLERCAGSDDEANTELDEAITVLQKRLGEAK